MKIGAVAVRTLVLATIGTQVRASPREITKYLMNQPVSRLTFGLSELNNVLEQSRTTIGMIYLAASYNFESDTIKIHAFCGNCARDITEACCGEVIDSVRSAELLIKGDAPAGSSVFSTFFEQNGYSMSNEPKNLRSEIDNMISIDVNLLRGSASVHCEAPLIGKGYLVKRP